MPRKSEPEFKDGDILLFHDGEMAQVVEVGFPTSCMTQILSMFDDECRFHDTNSMGSMFVNLGQEPKTLALFHATRSIHVRLNKLGKV